MLRIEAIKKFLHSQPYTLSKLYNGNMEVQVNVSREYMQDNIKCFGEPITGNYEGHRWHGYTDGIITWKSFRIPWNAARNAQYKDRPINYDISKYTEAIGMTGWDYVTKQSLWVAFDFDSLIGHKKGLTVDEINEIKTQLSTVDFVSLYSSTSGNGLHLYVFISSKVIVETHTHHAALARSILNKISALTGLDLLAKVDTLGGNMWVWHRKCTPKSFNIIKEGKPLNDIPDNWQDYITYVEKKTFVHREATDIDLLCASYNRVQLDDEHLKLVHWFERNRYKWWWDEQRYILVCHTHALKLAYKELDFKGYYDTISTGEDVNDHNCFLSPQPSGAWIVTRYGKNTQEHPSWFSSNTGFTRTYLNRLPSLRMAIKQEGGIEGEKEFIFKTLKAAVSSLHKIGHEIDIPSGCENRPAIIKQASGKILISFTATDHDSAPDGWARKNNNWICSFFLPNIIDEIELPDNVVRHVTFNNVEDSWFIYTPKGWIDENKTNVSNVLVSTGFKKTEIDNILGKCILNHWEQTCIPFQNEYPGNRKWNRNAPQLRYGPEPGKHPTFDIILFHLGTNLKEYLSKNEWCLDYGIINGTLYLQAWLASIIQYPDQPVPYLTFYGPQNNGKSTFHEVLPLLIDKGICRADNALNNSSGFNGELAGSIVCVVEETNLSQKGIAADRIKDWVTSRTLSIHAKNKTPYEMSNHTHWIQCCNNAAYCPILPGDTRITLVRVDPLSVEIPKEELLARCEQEAPAFINTLLNFEIPACRGRFRIPVISTEEKAQQIDNNKTSLEVFCEENICANNGNVILYSTFFDRFTSWLDSEGEGTERFKYTSRSVSKQIPYVKGRHGNRNQLYVGNVRFKEEKQIDCKYKYILNDIGRLMEVLQ